MPHRSMYRPSRRAPRSAAAAHSVTYPFLAESLETRRLLAAVGPDTYGYVADPHPLEAIDLAPGGDGVFVVLDYTDDGAAPLDLGDNTFDFYGTTYTGSGEFLVSGNGFVIRSADGQNSTGPVITPLLADLVGSEESGFQVLGRFESTDADAEPERLVVEWNRTFWYGQEGDSVTFQAVLELNTGDRPGDIVFNYPDLATGNPSTTEGGYATVEIQEVFVPERHQLLVKNSDAPSPLVGTGKALRIYNVGVGLPRANAGRYTVAEGATLALDGTASTDPDDGGANLAYAWDLDFDGVYGEAGPDAVNGDEVGPTPTFAPSGGLNGPTTFLLPLRVTDPGGQFDVDVAAVIVENVAPTSAAIAGPASGGFGAPLTFTLTAEDPADQSFAFVVDWGDGTSDVFDGESGLQVQHAFNVTGNVTVQLTVDDFGGGTAAATHQLTINPVGLSPDPFKPGRTLLSVGGTAGDDSIRLASAGTGGRNAKPGGGSGAVEVFVNGASLGKFAAPADAPFSRAVVLGFGGDDVLAIDAAAPIAAELRGGDGNDTLRGGGRDDVLMGETGDDRLSGGGGRDLLIGGFGADQLAGDGGDDILIGGHTAYDSDPFARVLVMDEWSRTDQGYARRVDHLRQGDGLNSPALLNASFARGDVTVFDDGAADVLRGGGNDDWFFSRRGSDVIGDLGKREFSTQTI